MNEDEDRARSKFPTIQRSGRTVSASGIPGSSRPISFSSSIPRLRPVEPQYGGDTPLFEVGSEGPKIGFFKAADSDVLILDSAVHDRYLTVRLVSRDPVNRPAAPPLEDYEARKRQRVPRKTLVTLGRHKRKRKIRKSKKINENKRHKAWAPQRPARITAPVPPPRPARILSNETEIRSGTSSPAPHPFHGHQPSQTFQRARKIAFRRPPSPRVTPTPLPVDDRSSRLALDAIAQGIFRLDAPLARYSLRTTPLFLARNLTDGWANKVWAWDQEGKVNADIPRPRNDNFELSRRRLDEFVAQAARQRDKHSLADVTQVSLPRTFALKIKRFELGDVAKMSLPGSAKLGVVLYINNDSAEPIAYDLGVTTIDIPNSASNFLPTPHRMPTLTPNMDHPRPGTQVPFLVQNDNGYNVSLRGLCLPGGIAYVDLLFYDFTLNTVPIQHGVAWDPSHATRVSSRVELVGPNATPPGFAGPTQRVQLTWRGATNYVNGGHQDSNKPTDFQPRAFLHLDIDWGFDSAAPLPHSRVSNIPPQRPRPPPQDVQIVYRLAVQREAYALRQVMTSWACILCSVCAPFPTFHVLRVHIKRAHPQVQTRFIKKTWDANKRRVEIKMDLPPTSVELISDDEAALPRNVAPSTRIGAILATRINELGSPDPHPDIQMHLSMTPPLAPRMADGAQGQESVFLFNPANAIIATSNTLSIKQEERSSPPPPVLEPADFLPITRLESRSPDPLLGSPVRAIANRTGVLHEYSSRVNNQGRIYDILHTLPTKPFGALVEQVLACEEELFAQEASYGSQTGIKVGSEEGRLLSAIWARWMVTERNKFIRNPAECIGRLLESHYADVIASHVGEEHLQSFLIAMVTRRFIVIKQAAALMKRFKRYIEAKEQQLTE